MGSRPESNRLRMTGQMRPSTELLHDVGQGEVAETLPHGQRKSPYGTGTAGWNRTSSNT